MQATKTQSSQLVYLCHLLNIIDAFCTLHWLTIGVEEANPIMASAYEVSPAAFLALKFTLVVTCTEYIYQYTSEKRKLVIFSMINVVYSCVVCWHIAGFLATQR